MQTQLGYVEIVTLQISLNETFGDNIFTVILEETNAGKTFYLNYADNTPAQQVTEAINIANQNAQTFLTTTKINLYEKMNLKAIKIIEKKEKPAFSETEIQQAFNWLQNTSTEVPACVVYLAAVQSSSNTAAAQLIVDSQTIYQNYVNQINSLKLTAQTNIMNATSFISAKEIATIAIEQIKNVT